MHRIGRFTQDEVNAMLGLNPIYVPILMDKGADEGSFGGLPQTGATELRPTNPVRFIQPLDLKELDQIERPIDALITNATAIIKMANENMHMQSLVKFFHEINEQAIQRIAGNIPIVTHYDRNGEPVYSMQASDPSTKGMKVIKVYGPGAYDRGGTFHEGAGIKRFEIPEEDQSPFYETEEEGFFNKIVPQYYQIPEELYKYLTYRDKFSKFGSAIAATPIGKILGGLNELLKNTAINLNGTWIINNPFRHYETGMLQVKQWHTPLDVAKAIPDLVRELVKGNLSQEQWMELAAGQDVFGIWNYKDEHTRLKQKAEWTKAMQLYAKIDPFGEDFFMRDVAKFSEQLNRHGAFLKALKLGKNVFDAANEARNLPDYAIAGAWSRIFNRIFYFMTARLNWARMDREIIRKMMHGKKVDKSRIAIMLGASIAAEILWSWLNNSVPWTNDPEEKRKHQVAYYNLPAWRRNVAYNIPIGDNLFIPIPKGFFQIALGGMARMALESMNEHDRDNIAQWMNATFGSYFYFNPMDPKGAVGDMIPGQVRPLVEASSGYDFFEQKSIVPPDLENALPRDQYLPWTRNIYKEIGKITNTSPLVLETVANDYAAEGAKIVSGLASLATTGKVSNESKSFGNDMYNLISPAQFDTNIEYLGHQSASGRDWLLFTKDLAKNVTDLNKVHFDNPNVEGEAEQQKYHNDLDAADIASKDPYVKLYYIQDRAALEGWQAYLKEAGKFMNHFKASHDPDMQAKGKILELHITDVTSQLMKKVDQLQPLPSSPQALDQNTLPDPRKK